jgi:hypothetical protein
MSSGRWPILQNVRQRPRLGARAAMLATRDYPCQAHHLILISLPFLLRHLAQAVWVARRGLLRVEYEGARFAEASRDPADLYEVTIDLVRSPDAPARPHGSQDDREAHGGVHVSFVGVLDWCRRAQ